MNGFCDGCAARERFVRDLAAACGDRARCVTTDRVLLDELFHGRATAIQWSRIDAVVDTSLREAPPDATAAAARRRLARFLADNGADVPAAALVFAN